MKHLLLAVLVCLLPRVGFAETLRLATFNTELERDGPGLLLRDISRGKDPQVKAVMAVILAAEADILLLQGIDWDAGGRTLDALAGQLAVQGSPYPHRLALRPNRGLATGMDMNGDGRTDGPEDAQGFGEFTGQGGMALLSRFPIGFDKIQDFSTLLWRDLPGATLPVVDGAPFPSAGAQAVQRLSTTGHLVVPVETPSGMLSLLVFQAGPPVFDGPEDRNGLRNRDELRLWRLYLDGDLGERPNAPPVLMGGSNLDPWDSDGYSEEMRGLLSHRLLQDPTPESDGARAAPDQGHRSPNARDTVDWPYAGRLRVDYILPAAGLEVAASGVVWPAEGDPLNDVTRTASRHRLVWVDLVLSGF